MVTVSLDPNIKSLAVDSSEQNVYFSSWSNPINVVRLQAKDGSFVSAQAHSKIDGFSSDMKTFILSDNSGYFIFGRNSDSNSPSICKYLFSITESAYCQEISSLTQFVKAQLMLSNSEFFFIGSKPTTSYDLHFYKITYGSSHADWSKKMLCASACSIGSSETIVHTDNKKFYNYYMFGTSPNFYVGIVAFNLTNGDIIGSRYYSDIICTAFTGSTIKDGEVLTTVKCGGVSFIMIHKLNLIIIIKF